jgi:hypothetical protein
VKISERKSIKKEWCGEKEYGTTGGKSDVITGNDGGDSGGDGGGWLAMGISAAAGKFFIWSLGE